MQSTDLWQRHTGSQTPQQRQSCQQTVLEQLDSHIQRVNVDVIFVTPSQKLTQNVSCKTYTYFLLAGNMEENLDEPEHGEDFLDTTTKAWSM